MMRGTQQRQPDRKPFGFGRMLLIAGGVVLAAQLAMAVFGIPRFLTDWLTCRKMSAEGPVGAIVVLGGGGVPSQTGLVRAYYGAEAARKHPSTKVMVALASAGAPATNSVGRMRDELVLRGVAANRILLEPEGRNTAEQAAKVRTVLGESCRDKTLIVVTSPMHLRRSVLCFRKAGFRSIAPLAAEDTSVEGDLGDGLSLRYGFWNNWIAEIEAAREFAAIVWYRFRGRI
jgi:uncharacterized SAM-binding protein YcdF (DUF218 family)